MVISTASYLAIPDRSVLLSCPAEAVPLGVSDRPEVLYRIHVGRPQWSVFQDVEYVIQAVDGIYSRLHGRTA
jgi:hypothetical protein